MGQITLISLSLGLFIIAYNSFDVYTLIYLIHFELKRSHYLVKHETQLSRLLFKLFTNLSQRCMLSSLIKALTILYF